MTTPPAPTTSRPANALLANQTGTNNVATGTDALFSNMTGKSNIATGFQALTGNTQGSNNVATGDHALYANMTGDRNVAAGTKALRNNTGSDNVAIGRNAGVKLTTGSQNIDIANVGKAGEAGTIRIGTNGTQTATFIAGISGTTLWRSGSAGGRQVKRPARDRGRAPRRPARRHGPPARRPGQGTCSARSTGSASSCKAVADDGIETTINVVMRVFGPNAHEMRTISAASVSPMRDSRCGETHARVRRRGCCPTHSTQRAREPPRLQGRGPMTPTVPRTLLLAVGALLLVAAAVGVTLAVTRGEDDGGENSTVSPTIVPKAALPSGRELAMQIRTRPESITRASVITDGSTMCPYVVWMGPIRHTPTMTSTM